MMSLLTFLNLLHLDKNLCRKISSTYTQINIENNNDCTLKFLGY